MVVSSSYHVISNAWSDAIQISSHAGPLDEDSAISNHARTALTDALNAATKKGAWKVMEALGPELSKSARQPVPKVQSKPFGISGEILAGAGALILIILRALLEGIQAITAVAVRNYSSSRMLAK